MGASETNAVPRSQRNDNFIDKSFTVMADLIVKFLPIDAKSKEAYVYYRTASRPRTTATTPRPSTTTRRR